MAELDFITIKGFKSIASVEQLKLGAINVVIGPNGSGKSNFIGVFAFLHAIQERRSAEYVLRAGGAEKILHFGSKRTDRIELSFGFQNGEKEYTVELMPITSDQLAPITSTYRAPITQDKVENVLEDLGSKLDQWQIYHFQDTGAASPMKKTADLNDNRYLRSDGSNLASFLYYLREKHAISYNLIRQTIQRVAPFFDDFLLEPQRLNPLKIILEWKHKGSDAYFDASSLSDGTLRFIALTTLFLQPEVSRPSLILVDEPELGLHPYAITMLASLVKQVAPKTQVILSTQSSQLLDHFEPEDVLVADRVKGSTQFTRLDSKQLAAWLEEYSLGQLWEKNEFGGRPSEE